MNTLLFKKPLEKTINYFYDDSLEFVKIKRGTHALTHANWVVTLNEAQMSDAKKFLEKIRKQMISQGMVKEQEVVYVTQYFKRHQRFNNVTFEVGFIKGVE